MARSATIDAVGPRLVDGDAVEAPHVVPGRGEPGHEHPPDAPGGAGDHHFHGQSAIVAAIRSAASMNSSTMSSTTVVAGFDWFICPTAWPTK